MVSYIQDTSSLRLNRLFLENQPTKMEKNQDCKFENAKLSLHSNQ